MKFRLASLVFVSLVISACGGSDEVKTGTFAGSINQLHYKTKTQSGMTDASGTFKYQDGETVTFSVGGTTIGKADGAGTLTMFDLFDVTPPTDAVVINQLLGVRSFFNVASGDRAGFVQAVNAWTFLMALDVDGKVSNGIDLTGRHDQLNNVHVAFNFTTNDFLDEQLRIAAQVPNYAYRPFGLDAAITYLFATAQVAIKGDAPSVISAMGGSYTLTYDGKSQATKIAIAGSEGTGGSLTLEHDDDMRLVKQSSAAVAAGPAMRFEVVYTFGATGVYMGSVTTTQTGADPAVVTANITLTYDSAGRLTTYTQGRAGVSYQLRTFAYDDDAGTVTTLDENRPSEFEPVTYRSRTQLTYDAHGDVTVNMSQGDSNADGTYDGTSRYVMTYDGKHNVTKSSGTFTDMSGAQTTTTETYTYDVNGRVLTDAYIGTTYTRTTTFTHDGDSLIEQKSVSADTGEPTKTDSDLQQTYDAAGHLLTSDDKQFDDFGALESEFQYTFTYDANGNVATASTSFLGGAPQTVSYTSIPTANAVVAALQIMMLTVVF